MGRTRDTSKIFTTTAESIANIDTLPARSSYEVAINLSTAFTQVPVSADVTPDSQGQFYFASSGTSFTSGDIAALNAALPIGSIVKLTAAGKDDVIFTITQAATHAPFTGQTVITFGAITFSSATTSNSYITLPTVSKYVSQSGKYLTNDGTNVSWSTVDADNNPDILMNMGG
jgi:hypothetical protein